MAIQKKKKYSREQIIKAIKFWNMILENTSPLIDDLISVFGYHYVFTGIPLIPMIDQLNAIYDIVNVHVFGSKLNKTQIVENDEKCKEQNALLGYMYSSWPDDKRKTNVLFKGKDYVDENGTLHQAPIICVSKDMMSSLHLVISLASLVTHEMIHQFCIECGNALKEMYESESKKEQYDIHGEEFKKYMDIANSKFGLNVTIAGTSIDQSNIGAMKSLCAFAKNDYLEEKENDVKTGTYNGKPIIKKFIS